MCVCVCVSTRACLDESAIRKAVSVRTCMIFTMITDGALAHKGLVATLAATRTYAILVL